MDATRAADADSARPVGSPAPEAPARVVARQTLAHIRGIGGVTVADDCCLVHGDALDVLRSLPANTLHAIVTDPPYGLVEYEGEDHGKLRAGKGGVWRIPPGVRRFPAEPGPAVHRAVRGRHHAPADLLREPGR